LIVALCSDTEKKLYISNRVPNPEYHQT
jgi:hypothetical protein